MHSTHAPGQPGSTHHPRSSVVSSAGGRGQEKYWKNKKNEDEDEVNATHNGRRSWPHRAAGEDREHTSKRAPVRSGVQQIILARGDRRPSSLAPPDGNGRRQENYLDHEENSSDLCGLPSVTEHGGDAAIASGISIAGRAGTVRGLGF